MKISKRQLERLIERTVKEQFEWTDEELASMGGEEENRDEADEWFSNFTGELTGLEDDDDQPWDDEYVGKADRAERHVQEAKKKKPKSPAQKVRKPTAPPSRQHKDPTKYDRKRDKKVPLDEMRPGRRWAAPRGRGGSMVSGEEVAENLVERVMADIRSMMGNKVEWVDDEAWDNLEAAMLHVARQAYSELDELD